MPKRRFTLTERKQMAKEYADGASLRQIAVKYETSHTAVHRIIEREGGMRDNGGVYPKKSRTGLLAWLDG